MKTIIKRSIVLFPHLKEVQVIESIRRKYDPLHNLIKPHISVVFPFESNIKQEEIEALIRTATKDITPFRIVLKEITGTPDHYLFLNVKTGNDEIIRIHDYLYRGILEPFRDKKYTFLPHVTVGRFADRVELTKALSELKHVNLEFETIISEICVERIGEDERSAIESVISL